MTPPQTALAVSFALLSCLPAAAGDFTPAGVYGQDDRRELSQVQSGKVKSWADSTVALFKAGQVTADAEKKTSALKLEPFNQMPMRTPENPFGEMVDLCQGEPYKGQQTGAFCSGSLVAEDMVMTAGHCIQTQESCEGVRFVFGFAAGKDGQPAGEVPSDEVYSCAKLVTQKLEGNGADYAVVKLDRAVKNHKPLRIRRSGAPPAGTPLTVIGHPVGLPTKVAGGASIRKDDQGGYFAGNLDTYGGNSGSAVINTVTGEVEGILVRGGPDFEYDAEKKCAKTVRKMDDTGRGEDVTLVSNVIASIPDPNKPKAMIASDSPKPAMRALAQASSGLGGF
ncbi:MAG: trypsin-like peptidase domain-containing protein [Elusimicrobia bacterium]|nr:trypsin-like peptidase domain-containing protein [Elusimicrobiota bacterium]